MDNIIEFETLSTYLTLAKKTISKFSGKFYSSLRAEMLSSEEAISGVAYAIMQADWKWDSNRTGKTGQKKTRYSYRNQCALWAIQTYVSKKYSNTNRIEYSLDYTNDSVSVSNTFYSNVENKSERDPFDILVDQEQKDLLKDNIHKLLHSDIISDKQREQIYMYYFDNMTLNDIGKKYNVTREAIRQNIKKAITSIQEIVNHYE